MQRRFKGYTLTLDNFRDKIYVVCPKCAKKAIVYRKNQEHIHNEILMCDTCGHLVKGSSLYGRLNLDLWLITNCCGNELWVLNENHLEFLEKYVSAKLRERDNSDNGWSNNSIGSRFPQWIKDKNNRDKILKALNKLKKKMNIGATYSL